MSNAIAAISPPITRGARLDANRTPATCKKRRKPHFRRMAVRLGILPSPSLESLIVLSLFPSSASGGDNLSIRAYHENCMKRWENQKNLIPERMEVGSTPGTGKRLFLIVSKSAIILR
jgi:hypothetical protein